MMRAFLCLLSTILICLNFLIVDSVGASSKASSLSSSVDEKKVRVFFRKGKQQQDGPIPPGVMTIATFDLHNRKNMQLLTDKIDEALTKVEKQQYSLALRQLENEVLLRTDGCARDGEPDADDLITDCRAQKEVYPLVMESILMIKAIK